MRLLASLLAFLVLTPVSASSLTSWAPIAEMLAKSVLFVETTEGACTAFVINTEKNLVLTAAHCDGKELTVGGSPARSISKDTKKDLMVLVVEDLDKPALRLAAADPRVGDEVASLGFGYSMERPLFRVTHVSDDKTYIPFEGIGGPFFIVDAAFVPGVSGGPVVNAAGEVVMVVQRTTDRVGIGVGVDTIKSKTGRFWESR